MTTTVSQTPGLRFIEAREAPARIPLIYNPTTGDYDLATSSDGLLNVATYVWNTATLSWDKATQAGGGGGGGGAVTVADGADVTQGAIADAATITDAAGTLSSKLRGLVKWAFERMPVSLGQKIMAESLPVVLSSDHSPVVVTQTFPFAIGGTVSIATQALTPDAPTSASVGVASASILPADFRKGLVLTNRSTATISIAFGAPAVLNSGITLTPDGVFVMDVGTFTEAEVFAIASAAASTLAIQQFMA